MLPSFCTQEVKRIRPSTKESRGSMILDWSNTTNLTIEGCSMQPASTTLSEDGRVLGISDLYTLFTPPDADIDAGDRIEFEGKTFTVVGDVRVQPAASRIQHKEISLRRYHG